MKNEYLFFCQKKRSVSTLFLEGMKLFSSGKNKNRTVNIEFGIGKKILNNKGGYRGSKGG